MSVDREWAGEKARGSQCETDSQTGRKRQRPGRHRDGRQRQRCVETVTDLSVVQTGVAEVEETGPELWAAAMWGCKKCSFLFFLSASLLACLPQQWAPSGHVVFPYCFSEAFLLDKWLLVNHCLTSTPGSMAHCFLISPSDLLQAAAQGSQLSCPEIFLLNSDKIVIVLPYRWGINQGGRKT